MENIFRPPHQKNSAFCIFSTQLLLTSEIEVKRITIDNNRWLVHQMMLILAAAFA